MPPNGHALCAPLPQPGKVSALNLKANHQSTVCPPFNRGTGALVDCLVTGRPAPGCAVPDCVVPDCAAKAPRHKTMVKGSNSGRRRKCGVLARRPCICCIVSAPSSRICRSPPLPGMQSRFGATEHESVADTRTSVYYTAKRRLGRSLMRGIVRKLDSGASGSLPKSGTERRDSRLLAARAGNRGGRRNRRPNLSCPRSSGKRGNAIGALKPARLRRDRRRGLSDCEQRVN